jgi:glycosyltransferase involved in cell wall biosynthesis
VAVKKILYVCPNSRKAGAEQVTELLLLGHDPTKYEARVYFLQDGPMVKDLASRGVRCHVFSGAKPRLRNPKSMLQIAWDIAGIVRRDRISLIHSVLSYGHLFGGPAAVMAGIPSTWFQHGPCGPMDWFTARVPTQTIFVPSEHTAQAQSRYFARTERVRVVHPGTMPLEPQAHAAEASELRARWGVAPDHLVFGLIGRFSPLKGHAQFIEAASFIHHEVPQARFVMIGDSFMPGDREYEVEVRELSKQLGVGEKCIFAGPSPQPQWGALAACDVVVNASNIPESFGLTLIEGMMLGKPVIAPRAGGPLEIVTPGGDGLLFEKGNPEDLADRMLELAQSELSSVSAPARAAALAQFTAERMVREIEEEYDRIFSSLPLLKASGM